MMTLRQFVAPAPAIPAATSWYLADVSQALGKQELFTKQAPQKLKALREHALIESAVSSNRIEGVEATGSFNIADLQRVCPGVSVDMIRHVLKNLRGKREVECLGRSRNAVWKRTFAREFLPNEAQCPYASSWDIQYESRKGEKRKYEIKGPHV